MASIGNNQKWSLSSLERSAVRTFFETGLIAKRLKEDGELDLFQLDAGQLIGVQYLAPARALSPEQAGLAPWLEFGVDDLGSAVARMDQLGLKRVEYHDEAHVYFTAPGGIVFRLMARQAAQP